MPGISGKQLAGDLINFISGGFKSQIKAGTLTANRSKFWPDKDGLISISEIPGSFTSVVPLNGNTSFTTQTVSSVIPFTLSSNAKSACAKTTYRLIADGTNVPTFTGFTELSESIGYQNSTGIVNVITFEWDGVTAWYRVSQSKYALPSLSTIAITFSSKNAKITRDSNNLNVYYNNGTNSEQFTAFMTSAQTIPSGKVGRVVFVANKLMLVGFNNTSTLEDYNGYEYSVFGNTGGFAATVTAGVNGTTTSTASAFAVGEGSTYYRLTRDSSGVVTAEAGTNGSTWTLIRTFAQTFTGQLWICACLSGNISTRAINFISLEIQP